jgi:hypothetical protein
MKAQRLQRAGIVLVCLFSTSVAATPSISPAPRPTGMTPSLNPHAPYTISGRLSLITDNVRQSGSACTGQGPYADIQAGAPITITDSTGGIIGVSHLGTGHRRLTRDVARVGTCDFEFVVGGIPEVEAYGIRFERRGTLQYSLAEMKQQSWSLHIELRAD